MFEKLSQSGYLGTSLVDSATQVTEEQLPELKRESPEDQSPLNHSHSRGTYSPPGAAETRHFQQQQQQKRVTFSEPPEVVVESKTKAQRTTQVEQATTKGKEKRGPLRRLSSGGGGENRKFPLSTEQLSESEGNYHNKAFYLHYSNNNSDFGEHTKNRRRRRGRKNNFKEKVERAPLSSLSSPRSKENPFFVNNFCPSCEAERRNFIGTDGGTTSTPSIKKSWSFRLLHRLSMELPQDSSADLHRRRDDGDNGALVADDNNDDDDQPRDSLEDQGGAERYCHDPTTFDDDDEDDDDEDEEEDDNGEEMNREDLIRFLLANSGAGGGGGRQCLQTLHYQQLLSQQQYPNNFGGAYGFQRGVSASSSMHGAAGGAAGLEPIMDASFQDDFDDIHSDYQWFTESGFETDAAAVGCSEPAVGVPEYPVSLLGETGHHGNGADFDATMAQIDIEDFHSEDILLRLPPLCASDLQQGETIASITGSILQHLEFEDSMTPNSHSVDEDQNAQSMDMSICKSENLFSPMNENQEALPLSTFSTDSLDTRAGEILATCMTNRNNYTIAFQGMEESNTSSTYKTAPGGEGVSSTELIENDTAMMTNWRQVTSNNSTGSQRGSVDNNNGSNESSTGGNTGDSGTPNNNNSTTSRTSSTSWTTRRSLMTQSCPHPPRNNNAMVMLAANNLGLLRTNPQAAIKLFDIQNVQTVQLAQIYQRHAMQSRQNKQLGSGSSMTDSGSMSNNNNNNNNGGNNMMTSGSAGSSLSSGRHNTPQILEESWNNNRNPSQMPMPPTTPTHFTHGSSHPHPYSKYQRSRRHSSSTSTSSSSQPTTVNTQLADAVRKLRSIEIQTSITLVTPPNHSTHQKYYGNCETISEHAPLSQHNAQSRTSSTGSQSHHRQQHHHHNSSTSHLQQNQQPPPVYICYPSYTLPDLRFLEQHRPKNPVILMPQRYKSAKGLRTQTSMQCTGTNGGGVGGFQNLPRGRRPLSCNDIEELRSRDLSHVKDWPSLNFLLPKEYQAILAEIKPPEKREQRDDSEKETADIKEESCTQNGNAQPSSAAATAAAAAANNNGDEASGESPVILRRRINGNARANPTKRYSMNDAAGFLAGQQQQGMVGVQSNRNRNGLAEKFKRFSLQETLPEVAEITSEIAKNLEQLESLAFTATSGAGDHYHQHHQSEEGFDESHHQNGSSNNNNNNNNNASHHTVDVNIPSFVGGISSSEESTTSSTLHVNCHKRVPTNTPKQTSFVDFDNHFQLRNHGFFDDGGAAAAARIIAHVSPMPGGTGSKGHSQKNPVDMIQKQSLTDAVAAAVNQIQSVWETTQAMKTFGGSASSNVGGSNISSGGAVQDKNRLTPTSDTGGVVVGVVSGTTQCLASPHKSLQQSIMSQTPAGKVVLESLCPALYSLLSDGLCPFLDTIFGRVPNTVWRVVEASIQYGPTAQSLNELVLRINSEELLAEGPMKFNAFVCGLLNLRNLGSWLTFLRTKERLLRTHYEPDAFMFLCNTTTRFLYDQMLVNMHLLSKTPFPSFQLDIFHETKLLHQSMNPVTPTKSLPASLPVSRKNSVKGSSRYNAGGGAGSTGSTPRKSTSADARPVKTQSKNSKYHANQLKKSQMKRSFSDERPKTAKAQPSTIPKSKTAQNITHERSNQHHANPPGGGGGPTSTLQNTRLLSRFPSRPKLSNYSRGGSGGAGGTVSAEDEGREKGMTEPTKAQRPKSFDGSHLTNVAAGGGGGHHLIHKGHSPDSNKDPDRFRRLQMQWELLSSDESSKKGTSPGQSHTTSSSNTSNNTAPSLAGSKIPRPINSPTRANITTHLGSVRPSTGNKR